MRRSIVFGIILLVSGICIAGLGTMFHLRAQSMEIAEIHIVRHDNVVAAFNVELATTRDQHVQGLMHRERLEEGTGMLFVFETDRLASMWMRDMQFALDFLFIDADGYVVEMESHVPPCKANNVCPSIVTQQPVRYVLEIPAGSIDEHHIQMQDRIQFNE